MGGKYSVKGGKVADPRLVIYGASVRWHRQRKGWTQEQLALIVHYEDPTMISLIEQAERAPSFLKAVEIAELFETTVNAMCGYRPQGQVTHNHAGAVAMNTGFVMFGGLDFQELRAMVETVLTHQAGAAPSASGPRPNPSGRPAPTSAAGARQDVACEQGGSRE